MNIAYEVGIVWSDGGVGWCAGSVTRSEVALELGYHLVTQAT